MRSRTAQSTNCSRRSRSARTIRDCATTRAIFFRPRSSFATVLCSSPPTCSVSARSHPSRITRRTSAAALTTSGSRASPLPFRRATRFRLKRRFVSSATRRCRTRSIRLITSRSALTSNFSGANEQQSNKKTRPRLVAAATLLTPQHYWVKGIATVRVVCLLHRARPRIICTWLGQAYLLHRARPSIPILGSLILRYYLEVGSMYVVVDPTSANTLHHLQGHGAAARRGRQHRARPPPPR